MGVSRPGVARPRMGAGRRRRRRRRGPDRRYFGLIARRLCSLPRLCGAALRAGLLLGSSTGVGRLGASCQLRWRAGAGLSRICGRRRTSRRRSATASRRRSAAGCIAAEVMRLSPWSIRELQQAFVWSGRRTAVRHDPHAGAAAHAVAVGRLPLRNPRAGVGYRSQDGRDAPHIPRDCSAGPGRATRRGL